MAIPLSFAAQERITDVVQHNEVFIVSTDLITVNVSVTDTNGLAVAGLRKGVFSIFDNKKLQDIQFFSDEDVPLSVSIVFDTSGSMNGEKIEKAKESLARFIRTSKEQDEFFPRAIIEPDAIKGLLNREARAKEKYDVARLRLLGLETSDVLERPAAGENPFR